MRQTASCAIERKNFTMPIWALVLIETFGIWQMGVVFYSSKALTVDGITPLPVSADGAVLPMLLGYLAGAALAGFLPRLVGLWGRGISCCALVCILLMYAPLPTAVFSAVYYIAVFFCVSFIGVGAVLTVDFYSQETVILDGVVAAIVPAPFVALLHFEGLTMSFHALNLVSALAQLAILAGLSRVPLRAKMEFLPTRGDKRPRAPKLLTGGTVLLYTVVCLCALCSSAAAGSIKYGVSIYYIAGGVWAGLFALLLYGKKLDVFNLYTVFLGVTALGFTLWALPLPVARTIGLAFQGAGIGMTTLAWLFPSVLFERWNTRCIAPAALLTAMITALAHSALLNALRDKTELLYAVYIVIILSLLVAYFLLAPYFHNARRQGEKCRAEKSAEQELEAEAGLTRREREVAVLAAQGYTNADIAKMLFISEHTAKDHIKSIYRKLGVHSRFELASRTAWGKTANKD